jgi:alkylhydroperoxidase family enzyme
MGHSEMLLAVAGLKTEEIKQRTAQIASGDWSALPPDQRTAFSFAHKLTKAPASITEDDMRLLVESFGEERALDLVWHIAWCNYMTRVADAFQLPLEPTNIFAELESQAAPAPPPKVQ